MSTVDHVERGLSRLPYQFKDSPNVNAVLQVFLEEIQEVETALQQVLFQQAIDNAEGFQLDIIGEHVAILREGRTDAQYRSAIRIKVFINASQGTYKEVLGLWRLLLGSNTASLTEEYPAGINLYSDVGLSDFSIVNTVALTVPSTVQVSVSTSYDASPAFGFVGDGTTLGFGSTSDAGASGGKFIGRYLVTA